MYGKVTLKKHKTWDGDGFLEVTGKSAILKVIVNFIIQKDIYCFNIFDNKIYFMIGFGWQSYRKKNNQF